MDNRIRTLLVSDKRLDPAESEILVAVYPEHLTPGTEVKGRLMGPSCPYVSTVEVAYHLQPVARTENQIAMRAVIPEPCLWDPQTPFLYHGPLELWQDGQRCDQRQIRRGLRSCHLSAQELRVNAQSLLLRGTCRAPQSDQEARALHDQGYNLVLVSTSPDAASALRAERFGYFMLVRHPGENGNIPGLKEHAGLVLWEIPAALSGKPPLPRVSRMGVELAVRPAQSLPQGDISFILCPEQVLSALADVAIPKLLLVDHLPPPGAATPPDVVGWIEREEIVSEAS